MGIGSKRAGPRAENGAATGHVIKLHHALGNVEGMMIRQRDHARAKLDALGAFAGGGQKHFRRGDHFPTRGVMLAAPELIVAERVELFDQVEVAAKLQHRVLADRMVRGKEGAELETGRLVRRHGRFLQRLSLLLDAKLWGVKEQRNLQPRHAPLVKWI